MDDIVIKVDKLNKDFKLPHEKNASVKSALINFSKSKGYEMQHALDDISFEVKAGDFFGVVGRNGSGKSTLLKILAGIYVPTVGTVDVIGKLTPFIELGVGFNPELSGRENVFLNGALLGFNRREMRAMYKDIVDFAELERFMDQKLKNYSSGMQVRLAFSIATRAKSDILLIDEVLAVGDGAFQQKCFNYFEELKRQKKTVVFVSHDMNAVRRFCNKTVYIKDGKITHRGSPSDIADIYLEENMDTSYAGAVDQPSLQLSKKHSLIGKITEKGEDFIDLQFNYKSAQVEDVYIGMSVIKEGISIAGITTSWTKPISQSARISYRLDTSIFNGGVYQVGVGLYRLDNKELLSVTKKDIQFMVKGDDPTRGGAIKLIDSWSYE